MTVIRELLGKLSLDSSDWFKGLDQAEKRVGVFDTAMTGLGKIGGLAIGLGIGAGVAGVTALTGAIVSSIGPASDLSETISKTRVVFGDQAEAMIAFGETAANSLGLSENAALSAAGTYGNLFRSMGITTETSFEMSKGLVTLAGDLASFNNMDPTEVLDALRSGLTGETEPLKRLGINVTQATAEAKALELGLWDGIKPLDASAKAQAVYAIALEQTTLAQGDFARTSKGAANQQRIIKANIENLKASFGSKFLPILEQVTSKLIEVFNRPEVQVFIDNLGIAIANFAQSVINAFPQILAWFQKAFGWLQNNQGVIVAGLAILGTAIAVFVYSTVIPALAAFIIGAAPVILAMALIGGAAYLLYQAWTTNFGGIQEKVAAVWAFIQPLFQTLIQWLQTNIPVALQALSTFWTGTLLPAIQAVWAWLNSVLFPFFRALGSFIGAVFMKTLELLAAVWSVKIMPALTAFYNFIKTYVWPILQTIGNFVGGYFVKAFQNLSIAIQKVTDFLKKMTDIFKNLRIPAWLTPGSPTPLETGLIGISKAMNKVQWPSIPGMNLTAGSAGLAGAGAGGVSFNIYVQSDGITDENEVARKIASAIDVRLRDRGLI